MQPIQTKRRVPYLFDLQGFKPRHKFMMVSALTIVPLAVAAIVLLLSVYRPAFEAMDRTGVMTVKQLIPISRLEKALLNAGAAPGIHLVNQSPGLDDTFEERSKDVDAAFASVVAGAQGTAMDLTPVREAQTLWRQARQQGLQILATDAPGPAQHMQMAHYDTLIERATDQLDLFENRVSNQIETAVAKVESLKRDGIVWTLAAFLVSLSFGVGISVLMTHERASHDRDTERDPLTGLYNRNGLESRLEDASHKALVMRDPVFTLLIVDVDRFHAITEHYGKATGEEVLRTIAQIVRDHLRDTDVFARWGEDEFVVLLDTLQGPAAASLAERIRSAIEHATAAVVGDKHLRVTVTGGYATFPRHAATTDALIETANAAMARAREDGANRIYPASASRVRASDAAKARPDADIGGPQDAGRTARG